MTEFIYRTWAKLDADAGTGMHLVDSPHPLEFFVGRTETGLPRVVIRGTAKPQLAVLSNLVLVDRFQDGSGKWNTSFALQDARFEEVFLRLADTMHSRSSTASTDAIANDRVRAVIEEWRRLLKPRSNDDLTMEELRGLVGELWLILNRFAPAMDIDAAIEGWQGPLGLPQDFFYPTEGFFEAKSIGPSTTRLRISSAEQLDVDNLRLLVLIAAGTSESSAGATNLPSLLSQVRDQLSTSGASDVSLNLRLERLGVDVNHPFYRDTWFSLSRVSEYRVGPEFPAIRASLLQAGVEQVRYQLSVDSIAEFRESTMEVAST